ncbi:GNAT family N-acetyltransferase [Chromobacterium violaceum]|nr:GNAT family N-acetyltransferase [Chromobacterium violaceum]MBA8736688.1 GNAT family N-acetyltransferase [Chromobacterium violaceum]MBX9268783.1 GNAT family N-acetyltransferase [Chromobacterium violaceum]MCD0492195.1 GNAT family N-acetyltransferase [Chromobacterium violaceum]OQS25349.1 N-acetyltransferase [Chromobacterium violaceum]QIY81684.1 GNAT family N-acetyltransferase [Chromobacterium violaceum]
MRAISYRIAHPDDVAACVAIRGQTRENAISEARLNELGITRESWAQSVRAGELAGVVAEAGGRIVGYCFGGAASGEIAVLALLPAFEGAGLGKTLLARVMDILRGAGHQRLFLGCSSDPTVRSYGFYRHLGWQSTGEVDAYGDEVLEYLFSSEPA